MKNPAPSRDTARCRIFEKILKILVFSITYLKLTLLTYLSTETYLLRRSVHFPRVDSKIRLFWLHKLRNLLKKTCREMAGPPQLGAIFSGNFDRSPFVFLCQ